jgi:hypothetical protein
LALRVSQAISWLRGREIFIGINLAFFSPRNWKIFLESDGVVFHSYNPHQIKEALSRI